MAEPPGAGRALPAAQGGDAGVKREMEQVAPEEGEAAKRQMVQPSDPADADGTRPPSQRVSVAAEPLPSGWEQFFSKRTGNPYWYNSVTRETTWARPKSVDVPPIPPHAPERQERQDPLDNDMGMTGGLPVREGVGDCVFFLKWGMCKFGKTCKYNHPLELQKGKDGDVVKIPPRTERIAPLTTTVMMPPKALHPSIIPLMSPISTLGGGFVHLGPEFPVRPGAPKCQNYMLNGTCSTGMACEFDHPPLVKHMLKLKEDEGPLPVRPEAADCDFFMKTGHCKFGSTCKFNHPTVREDGSAVRAMGGTATMVGVTVTPNGQFPIRPMAEKCRHYIMFDACNFKLDCRFDHPPGEQASGNMGPPRGLENGDGALPVRPGEPECPYFMKYRSCSFGRNCKYNHPEEAQRKTKEDDAPRAALIGRSIVPTHPMPNGAPMPPTLPVPLPQPMPLPPRPQPPGSPLPPQPGQPPLPALAPVPPPPHLHPHLPPHVQPQPRPVNPPQPHAPPHLMHPHLPAHLPAQPPAQPPAPSPPVWEPRRAESGHLYYYNPVTKVNLHDD